MQNKTELTLEQTQQGVSYEFLSDTKVFTMTMEILPEPTSNKLCDRYFIYFTATDDNSGPTYDTDPLEKVQSNDDYNLFAIERQHSKQPESINGTYLVEKVDNNVTLDSSYMSTTKRELLLHDLLILVVHKALRNVGIFEQASKEEMLEDLKYVKSVGKEVDDLKMEIDDLKSQLETEIIDFLKVKQTFTSGNTEKVLKTKNDSLIAELNRKTLEINDLKAQLHDKTIVNVKMRALLNKVKGKFVDTKQFIPKLRFAPKTNEKKESSKSVTPQILPQKEKEKQGDRNANVIKPGMYKLNNRTKKPNVVPISTRKPTRKANQSVATPHKKIVALDSTI
ncbi:hypothetical protein Tco_0577755 [Tanacetum coccineum]